MPSSKAIRSICISMANIPWGPPKPRKAPFGTVFVRNALPLTLTLGILYTPVAAKIARWSTTEESPSYAPPSNFKSISIASILLELSKYVLICVLEGCLFVVVTMSSSLSKTILTGFPVLYAARLA